MGSDLQPGAYVSLVHALHLGLIPELIHQAVHQIHQGVRQVGVRRRGQLLSNYTTEKTEGIRSVYASGVRVCER